MAALRRGAAIGLIGALLGLAASGCGGRGGPAPSFAAQWDGRGSPFGRVSYPEGLGVDRRGQLVVADTWNDRILCCDDDGNPVAAFGSTGEEKGQFLRPRSITSDQAGYLYIVDTWNQRVQKFSPKGRLRMSFGEKGAPWGYDEAEGKFLYPYGVAVHSEGFIFVSDFNNNRIHKFDSKGKFLYMWGIEGRQDGQFKHPAGLAMDKQDRLYVADLGNNRVQRFTFNGKGEAVFDGKWGEPGTKPGEFDRPYGVCVDEEGNFYVADFGNHRVQCFFPSGKLMYVLGKRGTGEGELDCPLSVAVDAKRAVYVLDWGNNRIQKFVPAS